jgi:MFS family permease
MTRDQRRIVFAVCVIVGLSLLMASGLTFLITPMVENLGLSDAFVEDILAAPSAAALLAVFAAGQLGDRFGHRKTLVTSSLIFSFGACILALANGAGMVEIGLTICAASAITMQIVGVGLLQRVTVEGRAHVSAFTTYGMVFPIAFLVFPLGTAGLLQVTHWRLIPLIWVIAGLLMVIITLIFLDSNSSTVSSGGWTVPILAGVSLAAGARALAEISQVENEFVNVAIGLLVSLLAALGCVVVVRRSPQASPFFSAIEDGMQRTLLVCVALVSLVGIVTFISIALEFFYDLTSYEAALAIIPAQIGAILGAKFLATRAINRLGGYRASRYLMLAIAITMLPLLLVQPATPAWYLVVVATAFSFAGMAALTVLNTEVMRRSPHEKSGEVSAFRTAASSLGGALGVGILGTIVISSVRMDEGTGDVTATQLDHLAASLRIDGALASVIPVLGWGALTIVQRRSSGKGPLSNSLSTTAQQ